jgi:hypothetical protein
MGMIKQILLFLSIIIPVLGQTTPTIRLNSVSEFSTVRYTSASSRATVILLGYRTPGDGGGGEFYLGDTVSTNLGTEFAISTAGKSAFRNYSGQVSVKWFGAYSDDTNGIENQTRFQNAIDVSNWNIFIPVGVYNIQCPGGCVSGLSALVTEDTLADEYRGFSITGENREKSVLHFVGDGIGLLLDADPSVNILGHGIRMSNLRFQGDSAASTQTLLKIHGWTSDNSIDHVDFWGAQSLGTSYAITNITRTLTTGVTSSLNWTTRRAVATIGSTHDINIGDWIRVDGVTYGGAVNGDLTFDGFYRVTDATPLTITYENGGDAVASQAVTAGTIQRIQWMVVMDEAWNVNITDSTMEFNNDKSAFGMLLENGNQIQIRNLVTHGSAASSYNNTCAILGSDLEGCRIDLNQSSASLHYGVVIESGWNASGIKGGVGPVFISGDHEGPTVAFMTRRREMDEQVDGYQVSGIFYQGQQTIEGSRTGIQKAGVWLQDSARVDLFNSRTHVGNATGYALINPTVSRERDANDVCTIVTSNPHGLMVGEWIYISGMSGDTDRGTYNGFYKITGCPDSTTFTYTALGVDETTTLDTGGTIMTGSFGYIIEPSCQEIDYGRLLVYNQANSNENLIDLQTTPTLRRSMTLLRQRSPDTVLVTQSGLTATTSRLSVDVSREDPTTSATYQQMWPKAIYVRVDFTTNTKGAAGTSCAVSLSNPYILDQNASAVDMERRFTISSQEVFNGEISYYYFLIPVSPQGQITWQVVVDSGWNVDAIIRQIGGVY